MNPTLQTGKQFSALLKVALRVRGGAVTSLGIYDPASTRSSDSLCAQKVPTQGLALENVC